MTARFKKFLYFFWGALGLVLVAFLTVLALFLSAYEKSLPDHAVSEWLETRTEEDWNALFSDIVSGQTGAYETASSASDYLYRNLVMTRDIYAVNDETTETELRFTVYSGRYPLAKLIFERGDALGFGLYSWNLSKEEVLKETPEYLFCEVSVIVKKGQSVSVNGTVLSDPETVGSPSLSIWEQSYADQYPCDRYSLGKMWSSPSVTVDGQSVLPDKYGNFVSDYTLKPLAPIQISVPKGAEVYCNDVLVNVSHIVSAKPFAEVSSYDTGTYILDVYEMKELFFEPSVSVLYENELLTPSPDDKNMFPYPYKDIFVIAPGGYHPVVNGQKVSVISERYNVPVLASVSRMLNRPVSFMKYSLGNMIEDVEMNIDELIEHNGVYYAAASEEECISVQNAAYDFIMTFVDYSAKAVHSNVLKARTLSGSQANRLIGTIENGMRYNAAYTRTFFTASVNDISRFADNGFVCTVQYVAHLKRNEGEYDRYPEEKTLQSTYRLYILFQQGKGYVFQMDLISE